jgi:hypothetical protein
LLIRRNLITGNDTVGVAILANPFGPARPAHRAGSDNGAVRRNVILNNGTNPDPERPGTPAGDIVYDGSSATQCFANNTFGTDFHAGITALFPCP